MKKKTAHAPILDLIAQTIYDKKGSNILTLDVRNISSMTDYLIIAEGSVARHVKSIADQLIENLQPVTGLPIHKEGFANADWIVLDYSDFIVHLFIPELREKYLLEKLWSNGSIVDVTIDIHPLH